MSYPYAKMYSYILTKGMKMAKKSSATPAPVFNYLETWDTRFGKSQRVVTRQNGKFVTNVSLTALKQAQ